MHRSLAEIPRNSDHGHVLRWIGGVLAKYCFFPLPVHPFDPLPIGFEPNTGKMVIGLLAPEVRIFSTFYERKKNKNDLGRSRGTGEVSYGELGHLAPVC